MMLSTFCLRLPAVFAAAILLMACSGRADEGPRPDPVPEVLTVRPVAAEGDQELRLPAHTQPHEAARIHPRATGFVEQRLADIGDTVEEGSLLAVISAPETDQAVREARAMVAKAKADEELARVNHGRAQALVQSGVVSQEMYSDRKANLDVTAATRAAASARLAAALERQGFQSVRAPFTGRIVARNVERGDRVTGDAAASQPLFVLHALDPLRIVVDVPQSASLQVKPGIEGEVTFPELPGQSFRARVVRSSGAISAGAGFMRAELRMANPGGRIPAGMTGTVTLRLPRTTPALVLPNAALVQHAGGSRVVVVEDGRVGYREVATGRNLGDRTEVVSGVSRGDTVVLSPNALLSPGARVSARPLKGGGPPRG